VINWLRLWLFAGFSLLAWANVRGQEAWTPIPKTDVANDLLSLIKEAHPSASDLPENSTYNYIWAQHMMTWMVAERTGLMTSNECASRLSGLLNRVARWQTYHGFYYDAYDPATGKAKSANVYFQGWWLWALILTRDCYPSAAETANTILSRLDYDAAGMVSSNHQYLVADRKADTRAMSYYIRPDGDISGELRTAVICYTWLTGDVKPWLITNSPAFIDVGGEPILAVYHHFVFDPFYVHTCFPEVGYFQASYEHLLRGANVYRKENGMKFYATRMEPIERWESSLSDWPNTEHRVSKPWIAWMADPQAPVVDRAWIPGYGVAQYFDNWNFYWGYGDATNRHPDVIGGVQHGRFAASWHLETLPANGATKPPKLTKILMNVESSSGAEPLDIEVNGSVVARLQAADSIGKITQIVPSDDVVLGRRNTIILRTAGTNVWRIAAPRTTSHYVQWSDDAHAPTNVAAISLTVFVDGQRAGRENPYAFLCRAAGVFGDFPWMLLANANPAHFGDHLVAWVGDYSTEVARAHVIFNLANVPKTVTYSLSPWERKQRWQVTAYEGGAKLQIPVRTGNQLRWEQNGRSCVFLRPLFRLRRPG